ncbi:hypothetical protein, partial [uncultured Ruegeria sp.]|uniref:hypothetical protein n=1 Tax=uncultured Ruegeria sp. TaxID=259304 RepID=UPI0026326977
MCKSNLRAMLVAEIKCKLYFMLAVKLLSFGSIAALMGGPAASQIVISEPVSNPVILIDDADVTIAPTGAVRVIGLDPDAVAILGDYSSTFSNEGFISAESSSNFFGLDTANGVLILGDVLDGGKIVNDGSVSATADSADATVLARANAYQVAGDLSGSLSNSGEISASANSGFIARAFGVFVGGKTQGDLTNEGIVSATASAPNEASASGYFLERGVSGDLSNAGLVSARATGGVEAKAVGVEVGGEFSGNFSTSGTVLASAVSSGNEPSNEANASGVLIGDMQGEFSNTGVITASAS